MANPGGSAVVRYSLLDMNVVACNNDTHHLLLPDPLFPPLTISGRSLQTGKIVLCIRSRLYQNYQNSDMTEQTQLSREQMAFNEIAALSRWASYLLSTNAGL
jgi:hypothetical protein